MTSVFVQTRGRPRHRDYDFLGAGPGEPWWRAYAGYTAFERPTVLVESDGGGYRVYLSGVPSARRDAVGTVIRYTLVLAETADGTAVVGPAGVLRLIGCWLDDQAVGGLGAVARTLDAEFPEDEVERMLAGAAPVVPVDVQRRVVAAVRSLPRPSAPPATATGDPTDWLGDLGAPEARAAFAARVDELVSSGLPGRALLLNLIGSADDLAPLLDDPRPLVVLAPDLAAGPGPLVALRADRGEVGAGKAPPSAATAAPRTAFPAPASRPVARPPRIPKAVVVLVVVTIALVVPLLLLAPLLLLPLLSR